MAQGESRRVALLDSMAHEILRGYGRGRTIVAIDGIDGAGKTRFAEALAARLGRSGHAVFRASVDDFHRSRAERHARGADSPEGFYRDSYDYGLLRRVLVDPFKAGRFTSFVLAAFDVTADAAIEPKWTTGPEDAVLVIDGIFLNRPELRGLWNYSIWLEVEEVVATGRMRDRDGESAHPERYSAGQALYLREAKPREAASAIVDNNDFDNPRRVFADSC